MEKRFTIIFFSIFILSVSALAYLRSDIRDFFYKNSRPVIPPEFTYVPKATAFPGGTIIPTAVPFEGVNLAVPFSPQAPYANWDLPYKETCEETSALLVHKFYQGQSLNQEVADQEIRKIVAWQQDRFGFYFHTTAEDTARILREYFKYKKVEVIYDVSVDDIKREILAGRPVIVPLAGRLLGNPYYTSPGPIYHMLVVKGITSDGQIITNDVGTKRGKNYIYNPKVFYNAMHDVPASGDGWPAGVDPAEYILTGRRAMIVVYPN